MKEIASGTVVTNDEESETSSSKEIVVAVPPPPIFFEDPFFRYARQCLAATGKPLGAACILVIIPLLLVLVLIQKDEAATTSSSAVSSTFESSLMTPTTNPPSMAPMPTPQPSTMPTWEPVVSPNVQIRLYWEEGYYWQEEREEMFYCMECADCDEYSTGDGWEGDCLSPGSSSARCRRGHLIWIEWCSRARGYTFEIIRNYESGNQIRVHGTDLCFSTVHNRYLELQTCNQTDSLQLWSPISDGNKFELRPYEQRDWSREEALCLSQQHHPKSEELVGLHSCAEARRDETVYWTEYSER